jgi:hypothetical protein
VTGPEGKIAIDTENAFAGRDEQAKVSAVRSTVTLSGARARNQRSIVAACRP